MSVNKYYKLYLKPEDLQGRTVTVKISKVSPEPHYDLKEKCDVEKLELTFEGKRRVLILNRSQADDLSRVTGEEDDEQKWIGQVVSLSPLKGYNGKQTIKISQPKASAEQLFKAKAINIPTIVEAK